MNGPQLGPSQMYNDVERILAFFGDAAKAYHDHNLEPLLDTLRGALVEALTVYTNTSTQDIERLLNNTRPGQE